MHWFLIYNNFRKRAIWIFAICLFAALQSCVDTTEKILSDYDNNKINLVVADNFNLSAFHATLVISGLGREFNQKEGPFTVLAPSDVAFNSAGFSNQQAVLTAPSNYIYSIANYHSLDGKYELNKLPFLFNQELKSRGGKLFATHWLKGTDTVLTINGSRILANNVVASNGLIQVIDRVLTPYVHDLVSDALAGNVDLTLFYEATRSSGVLKQLQENGPYTIFAPNNKAMIDAGYTDIHKIQAANVQDLSAFVKYHIVKDRRFIYDYILSTGASNKARQTMFDGNLVDISLVPSASAPGTFDAITLRGNGNKTDVKLVQRDELSGNGVLHVIDGSLKLYQ